MSELSFERCAVNSQAMAQVVIGEDLFRHVVEAEGKAVLAASNDDQLELDWSAAQCKTTSPDGREVTRVYSSADGVIVPTTTEQEKQKRRATALAKRKNMPPEKRRKLSPLPTIKGGSDLDHKQIYLTAFYDQGMEHRLIGLTRKDHRALGKLLKRDAARVRLRGAEERPGLVDGAVCLHNHMDGLPLDKVILDIRHLGEKVNEASRKTLGDGTEAGKKWSDQVMHTVRHEGYEPFFAELVEWRGKLRGGKREIADGLLNYAAKRDDMMPYDVCDQKGWDVGSGPMESMCGVTTDRVKGRRRRWDIENAEAMMALEVLWQSTNLWDTYWAKAFCNLN
jgi:hypothetical protein